MDLWSIILLVSFASIFAIIVLISRIKKISLFDGSDKTIKLGLPLVWLSKLSKYLKRFLKR